jgi:hypothetical protein
VICGTLRHWYILLCKNLVYPFWKCVASSSNGRFNILNPSITFARVGLQAADRPFLSIPFPCLLVQASSCQHVYSTGPSYRAKQWQQQHNQIMLCFLPPPSSYLPFAKDRIHQMNESIQKQKQAHGIFVFTQLALVFVDNMSVAALSTYCRRPLIPKSLCLLTCTYSRRCLILWKQPSLSSLS